MKMTLSLNQYVGLTTAKRLPAIALLTFCFFSSTAIAGKNAQEVSANDNNSIRIISAEPGATEILYALEANDKIIALDLASRHYLKEGEDKPILGYHRQLSPEGILALSPTHVIGSKEMGPDKTLHLLRSAGVALDILPTNNLFADFINRLDHLATLTNTQEKAKEIKKRAILDINQLQQSVPEKSPTTIFIMGSKGRPLNLAGDNTSINTIITLAGGTNPASTHTSFKPYSSESVLEVQPDYILVSSRSIEQHGGLDALIEAHPLLKLTPAYKNNALIPVPSKAILGGIGLASIEFAKTLNTQFTTPNTVEKGS